LIVGGGIKEIREIQLAHQAGADIVVIGTAFEENPDFFN
jgi:putative glycerol-1-phosphate prenyltransferase